ncbi:46508_t:CDS:2, partial [Gigaspora margarita]
MGITTPLLVGLYEEMAIKLVKGSIKYREPFLKKCKLILGISRDEKTNNYILELSYANMVHCAKALL